MSQKKSNTLFIGNGFSRAIFKDMPSWENLFDKIESNIKNYTILYEMFLLDKSRGPNKESRVKEQLVEQIKEAFSREKINKDICGLKQFGEFLVQNNVDDIITTNYDKGIEILLCELCGYTPKGRSGIASESIYSIRTHEEFFNEEWNHTVRLWKIHGDLDRIKSVTLGFDQYCGALAKIESYIKGRYEYEFRNKKIKCRIPMVEKCRTNGFDKLSWVELFFNSNVYIVGFGMDFSEIDIWWLVNKRARFKAQVPQINNRISYLYDPKYIGDQTIIDALKAFDVECKEIKYGNGYINNIFQQINADGFNDTL